MNRQFSNNDKEKKQKILYEPNDILLKEDRERVSQVISNLLSNAAKFTPEGTISIVSDLSGNQDNKNNEAIISVKDNGQGIDPDMLPKLFSKFATKSFSGTGLGLYISKKISWKLTEVEYGHKTILMERGLDFLSVYLLT